jgi:beta-lactamase superfamily II metal-dependent hydrolase
MGEAGSIAEAGLAAAANIGLAPSDLALFVLNVGDGDALVIRFPIEAPATTATYGIVDSFAADKTIALVEKLGGGTIRFVCATHPHLDHIRGLRKVLQHFGNGVVEFWDSGFRYTSDTYRTLMEQVVSQSATLRFIRPTSGFELAHAGAQVTVLSPSIALRNRYDTHGVDVNNASIVLRVTYPVRPPSEDYPSSPADPQAPIPKNRTMILGGDAQTDAWGQVLQEFPHLDRDEKNWVRQIGAGSGTTPLACDLFKVSHHGSKRGVDLELLERMGDKSGGLGPSFGPRWMVGSSSTGTGSTFGFPHAVTQELMREVRDPQAQAGGAHEPDDKLGIHFTAQTLAPSGGPAGSIAFVMRADASMDLYRFGDTTKQAVDLDMARRVK